MNAEKVIFTLLNDNLWESDDWWILGGVNVYAQTRPESDPLPACVISKVSDVPYRTVNGRADTNKYRARIQCECLGSSPESAKQTAESVVDACQYQTGVTIAGVAVDTIMMDAYGPDTYDPLTDTYGQPVDLIVIYDRPVTQ
jgi:hypothetical protein